MPILAGQTELDELRSLDSKAVGAVFDRYYPDVYRFVRYRLNDETTAEDIASEVFVRLLEAIKSGHPPQTSLKAWLLGTAAHIVTDHFRQSYRRPTDELPETLPDKRPDPIVDVEQRERTRHLKDAMSKLTDEQQNVLALRFGQGYSLEETADFLKKNVNAVKQLQFRALAALNRSAGEIL
ncbi:MAG: sigma-70 family RNA polymerase sigma factor [Anaerolineales bacterium]